MINLIGCNYEDLKYKIEQKVRVWDNELPSLSKREGEIIGVSFDKRIDWHPIYAIKVGNITEHHTHLEMEIGP